MGIKIEPSTWLYVIVISSGKNDQILGQIDNKNNVSFIPAFRSKIAAEKGLAHLSKETPDYYEIQAIIYEDLEKYATDEKFNIFIVDKNGNLENNVIS